ncbi:MAG: PIN domain-containing protein [Actinomycetota bacterium]|nr:PIN domain-containing protein [Actinomycetota bacterium]
MTVLADTSALYALLDRNDIRHTQAAEAFPGLLGSEGLVTHNYVVVETTALVQHRLGAAAARRFLDDLVPSLSISWVDEDLHRAAVDRLLRGRRKVSLVDWVSFELMRRLKIGRAFAFDPDFEAQGFRTVT